MIIRETGCKILDDEILDDQKNNIYLYIYNTTNVFYHKWYLWLFEK